MIRARFFTAERDFRPVVWPIKHPYWRSGVSGGGRNVLIAYADSEEQLEWWPEAENIDTEKVTDYSFTSRFPRPEWFK